MGVSRTPVREALSKLVNEKLVTQTSSGTAVLGITAKDADDMYCVKSFLEPMVCRLAARNRSDEQLARMKDILDQQEFYTEKGNMEKVKDLDTDFHDVMYAPPASDLRVYPFLGAPQTEKVPQGIPQYQRQEQSGNDEHMAIYEAIRDRDEELAEKLAVEHVKNAYANITKGSK